MLDTEQTYSKLSLTFDVTQLLKLHIVTSCLNSYDFFLLHGLHNPEVPFLLACWVNSTTLSICCLYSLENFQNFGGKIGTNISLDHLCCA